MGKPMGQGYAPRQDPHQDQILSPLIQLNDLGGEALESSPQFDIVQNRDGFAAHRRDR